MVKPGIYEQVISKDLKSAINDESDLLSFTSAIDDAEAPKVLSDYLATVVERGLTTAGFDGDVNEQVRLVNEIIENIVRITGEDAITGLSVDPRAEQLMALTSKRNFPHSPKERLGIPRPETSISRSSLFTGALHEPSMMTELKKEITSSDRIDMLVSFIKWSGLRLIMDELMEFTQRGGHLRVVATSYMGATDVKAIECLSSLMNTEVKISYDTKRTRLHAKAYIFSRESGFSTAYIGSSNLSHAAISSGLEWNVKITAQDMQDTMRKVNATFDSYWNSPEFELFCKGDTERLRRALNAERMRDSRWSPMLFDIHPYPFQQEILDKLAAERTIRNHFNNLIVAATGTGKTVISAFDYKRFCHTNIGKPNRLLFIAHREEILKQSLACFQSVLRDPNFGDLFVGNSRPEQLDHLFMSIQTFKSQGFDERTSPEFYDFIIVDEFHHAAAPSYQRLLEYYKPKIMLGLTATPERLDGKSILPYFDNKIAAEIRLPEAIDRKLLCPFHYFGVTDAVDLSEVKWARGGYDTKELSALYTWNKIAAERRADMILRSIHKYVTDLDEVKGLGFCVSVEHANFMARIFNEWKVPSISLTADSSDEERNDAKRKLLSGEIRFIFVVDLYNEGVDIPEVNTVLFLRPTESLTVFLQQLGRGLRLAEGKECLTVLDFIGQANKRYRFEDKFSALLGASAKSVQGEIRHGFPSLPKGCYIQLERKAKQIIFDNIRSALNTRAGLISRIASFAEDSDLRLSLKNFLSHYHLDIRSIYSQGNFSRLCVDAGVISDFSEPQEELLTKAFRRICAIDSQRWIEFMLHILLDVDNAREESLLPNEKRMLQMWQFTIWNQSAEELGFPTSLDCIRQLKRNPILYDELLDILRYQLDNIDFLWKENDLDFECPLDLYCTYTRDQIMVALDYLKPSTVREGTRYLPEKRSDVFFVTLNKSEKEYSPTTMYNDYSINEWLFHWQSQSTTSDNSPTGQRYFNHKATGNHILLFVRQGRRDAFGNTAGYTFLGTADYVSHEGSRPISIVWKLHQPMPARFLRKTNQMID